VTGSAESGERGRHGDATSAIPTVEASAVPWLSVEEMRAVDDAMVGDLGIELKQMMENAGRNLAVLARALLGGSAAGRVVTVLAGPGGNGGGGLVAARHLLGADAIVHVRLAAARERLAPVTADQVAILTALGADILDDADVLPESELVVDALLGYSQSGPPRGNTAGLIEAAAGRRVLALDVPSGLELSSGVLHEPHVRAEATMTLAAPKAALRGAATVGDLYLADISVPAVAFEQIGRRYATPFAEAPLVRVVDR
jgi:NAD(P)H-hydrate epimerase